MGDTNQYLSDGRLAEIISLSSSGGRIVLPSEIDALAFEVQRRRSMRVQDAPWRTAESRRQGAANVIIYALESYRSWSDDIAVVCTTESIADAIDLAKQLFDGDITLGADKADPIPMRLTCPVCSDLHIDVGEFATKPHHTHACQECGNVWRPAVVATVGVRFLPGFRNGATP